VTRGKVYLVGAGPGDPGLITIRGVELLKAADCVIYDRLANPALLRHAADAAELINVGKRTGNHSYTQNQINALLIEKAKSCKTVVRLKGGDPCIFGRAGEELKALVQAGIEFEIVPGVTAAVAAAEYTGIMLTDRDYNSQVLFITGKEAAGKQQSNIDFSLLAKFSGTIVFHMAVNNLEYITAELIKSGMSKQTNAAVIVNATLPTQRVIKAPLAKIAQRRRQMQIQPPAIVVIGSAADSNERLNWFTNKPLFGFSIVTTRDATGNAAFAEKITQRGARPIQFPTIKLKALTNSNKFVKVLGSLNVYDWVVFTSANGVSFFFEALAKLGKDGRVLGKTKITCIGPRTAERLKESGISADFVPAVFTSLELAKAFAQSTNLRNKNILLLRSAVASKDLAKILSEAGANVNDAAVYTTLTRKNKSDWLTQEITAGQIDWITFTSPSTTRGFFEQINVELVNKSNLKTASIGPITSAELKNLGVTIDVEARQYTTDGLLDAIESFAGNTANK